MKAALCVEPGRLTLVDRPTLETPPPGHARLKVSHVGICGTDYHIYEGKHPFLEYPRVMGHEISATVLETGEGVDLPVGTPVIVNPYVACGNCIACRKDKPNCCTSIRVLGVHTDGAMCEEIMVPAQNLYPAGSLSLEAAATVEFLAIGAHAVRRSMAPAGSRALVIGAGPIGLGTALFARIAGHDVTLLDASAERLAMAKERFGFQHGLLADDNLAAAVNEHTDSEGFDAVFDATGHRGSMEKAFTFVAHGGCLVLVSVVKEEITFSDPEFHKREMSVIGSRNATRIDFDTVIEAIARGDVPVEQLITHRTTLSDVVDDLPRWAHVKTGLVKAVIRIGD